jgi:PAS domain S-box-containing protein
MTDLREFATDDRAYRLLVEAVVDYAVYLLDTNGRVSTWNPGAERIKGYAAEEVIGQPFSMFFTEEDRRNGMPEAALDEARRSGRFESEGWRVRKDGSRFWALAVLDVVRDERGEVIGFAKITRDITQREAARQALLESERRFRLLIQGVTDYAIFMLDPAGVVTNWNTGAHRIKGYEEREIVGQHFSRFYTDEDRVAGVPRQALAQASVAGRFEAEGWRVRKDGTRFWANVVIDAVRDETGELVGFAKVTRDLTERHHAEQVLEETRGQLVQLQKLEALGQLTGGVAHDFNNLLQVISGGVALAEKLPPGDLRLRQILAEMRAAAARGTDLTRQLLAFSRRTPLSPEMVSTGEAIDEAAALMSRTLGTNIRLAVNVDEGVWPVRIDKAQFELALLNLGVNARDAMPDGGALRITAKNVHLGNRADGLVGPFVSVSVCDTGVGIPEEILSRIFEPFFTTKPVGKGTGLGLSQVHGFAQQAGGTVTISSEVGKGTEITILVPAALEAKQDDEKARSPGLNDSQRSATQQGLRILVVDDDPVVGRLTVGMLEGSGHDAAATTDAGVALAWLGQGRKFDLVVSDVVMPGGMSGVDLAREVQWRWPELPVLLVSGYADDNHVAQHQFPMLHKPFTALELTLAIRALLQRRAFAVAPSS